MTKIDRLLAPLADVVQVVVPDQRGHGRSDQAAAHEVFEDNPVAVLRRLRDFLNGLG
jgi:pimeloyl-ACP methyl ester carboxylesterase